MALGAIARAEITGMTNFAKKYDEVSDWQFQRGVALLGIAAPVSGETVLDLGCGTGQLSYELARRVGPGGRVIAVDPDRGRLAEARSNKSPDLANITFVEAWAEDLSEIGDGTIDLIFSNYAFHWVPDKVAMIAEWRRCLRRGGRCAAESVGVPVPFLEEVVRAIGSPGRTHLKKVSYPGEAEWRAMFERHDLAVGAIEWPYLAFAFADLASFFDWLEGTTGGDFTRDRLPNDIDAGLRLRFPGDVRFAGTALRVIVRRR
ncbi:MAG: class I SAM-dependent methyltransferase [Alphaproteobacteria bacterium]|nr:class I SAM-dependent methyltransferase [Alphaproteobacteria bacterium]